MQKTLASVWRKIEHLGEIAAGLGGLICIVVVLAFYKNAFDDADKATRLH